MKFIHKCVIIVFESNSEEEWFMRKRGITVSFADFLPLIFLQITSYKTIKRFFHCSHNCSHNIYKRISILSYCQKSRKSVLERTKVIILPFKLDQEDEDIAFNEFMSQTYRLFKKEKKMLQFNY